MMGQRRIATDNGKATGFTLVELMLVLALLTLLASAAFPSLSRWQRGMELDRTTEEIRDLLHAARIASVDSGSPVVVTIDPATGDVNRSDHTSRSDSQSRTSASSMRLPVGVKFEKAYIQDGQHLPCDTEITFYPDGTASQATFMVVNDTDDARIIRVNRMTGSVRVEQ